MDNTVKNNNKILLINGCIDQNTNSYKIANNIGQDYQIINLVNKNIEEFNNGLSHLLLE